MMWGGGTTKTQWERHKARGLDAPLYEGDDKLEAAIDHAGRERVFERMRSLGWSVADSIPKFVWWGVVTDLDKATA